MLRREKDRAVMAKNSPFAELLHSVSEAVCSCPSFVPDDPLVFCVLSTRWLAPRTFYQLFWVLASPFCLFLLCPSGFFIMQWSPPQLAPSLQPESAHHPDNKWHFFHYFHLHLESNPLGPGAITCIMTLKIFKAPAFTFQHRPCQVPIWGWSHPKSLHLHQG